MAKYFDKAKGIYRDAKGKEIPYGDVRQAVNAVADDAKARLRGLAERFNAGKIDLPSWATQSDEIIRRSLISSGQIAAGGRAQMTASLNGTLGQRVRFHLDKFREMTLAVERGELSAAQLLARVEMYGDAVVNVFESVRLKVMIDAGFTEAKNLLGAADHCGECVAITAQGWIPIEEMKPTGTRQCLSRDRCTIEYR